ncbi:MAG TPA: BatD family protein [Chitinivibrionales bacterium]|nr:BatD family protein [Chitinivibrionales bacterium]
MTDSKKHSLIQKGAGFLLPRLISIIPIAFGISWSQNISFSVTADRTSAMLGEQIQIQAQITSSKQLAGLAAPQVPKSEDFDVLGVNRNQSSSTSISVVNGAMTQSVTTTYFFNYAIAPKKTGTFTFPALQAVVDGKPYSSAPFAITIGKEAVQTTDVRVVLQTGKKSLFTGEQTILTVKVCQKAGSQAQLSQQGLAGLYDKLEKNLSKDFAVARLFNQLPSKSAMETVNGEKEFVVKVQYALFPISTGDLSIQPVPFEYVVLKRVQPRRNSDPFGDFFGDDFFGGGVQQIPKSVLSNRLIIHAAMLPPPPAGFSGAVGSFSMNAGVDPRQVPSGEAVTLTATVRGTTRPGNMGDLALPQLAECEVLAPEKHVSLDTTQNGISCVKTYRYPIIPRQEGTLSIPPLSWIYFDPAAQAYKTLRSDTLRVAVTKGKTAQAGQTRYLTQEEIQQVGQDIRFIKTGAGIRKQTDQPYKNPVFFILFPLPFLLALFSLLYKIQAKRYERDASLALRQKAVRRACRAVATARKKGQSLTVEQFLAGVSGCLEDFITHKFGFAATGKTRLELQEELKNRGAQDDLVKKLVSFLEGLDAYRFGRAALDTSLRNGILNQTEGFIRDLAKQKKGKPS